MKTYWILEYLKVFSGYMFLMFIWPTVVFWNHLRSKTKIYHFSFCVTVQIVLINTFVLMMGLFRILNKRTCAWFFACVFLGSIWQRIKNLEFKTQSSADWRIKVLLQYCSKKILKLTHSLWKNIRPRIWEYTLLFIILIFGMFYFSYGAFQTYCYGQGDLAVHHLWVNDLVKGNIFSNGVYPEAMHCFIYCLYVLFGIRIYSIMMFLQSIHIIVFFVSAYIMFREMFCWRFSSIFLLALYLTVNVNDFSCGYTFYRLQMTLPMEFGLHTQFLCLLYLIKYLNNSGEIKLKKYCLDENLFIFMMSLAASVAIHYYTTIMVFILCFWGGIFSIKKIFCPRYLIPLIASAVCGFIIAGIPMAGALASGIPFESSIDWGLKVVSGNGDKEEPKQIIVDTEISRKPLEPTSEDREVLEKLPGIGQRTIKFVIKIEYFIKEIYKSGYLRMYGAEKGRRILWVTIAVIFVCLLGKRNSNDSIRKIFDRYPLLIILSIISIIVYMAYAVPALELPALFGGNRFSAITHLMVLAAMIIPADVIMSVAAVFYKDYVVQIASVFFTIGIYIFTNLYGLFHEYLYYSLTRYNSAVMVTESIIEEFPRMNYTVISPFAELCQVELYGMHKNILEFIEGCDTEHYTIPTKYVFIYVEKRPIEYYQKYYFNGPSWLAKSGNSEIKSTEISKRASQKDLSEYQENGSELYGDRRTILESKAYEWCHQFSERNPSRLNVYYEDDDFVCYYFEQNPDAPYNLAGDVE